MGYFSKIWFKKSPVDQAFTSQLIQAPFFTVEFHRNYSYTKRSRSWYIVMRAASQTIDWWLIWAGTKRFLMCRYHSCFPTELDLNAQQRINWLGVLTLCWLNSLCEKCCSTSQIEWNSPAKPGTFVWYWITVGRCATLRNPIFLCLSFDCAHRGLRHLWMLWIGDM